MKNSIKLKNMKARYNELNLAIDSKRAEINLLVKNKHPRLSDEVKAVRHTLHSMLGESGTIESRYKSAVFALENNTVNSWWNDNAVKLVELYNAAKWNNDGSANKKCKVAGEFNALLSTLKDITHRASIQHMTYSTWLNVTICYHDINGSTIYQDIEIYMCGENGTMQENYQRKIYGTGDYAKAKIKAQKLDKEWREKKNEVERMKSEFNWKFL